MSPRSHKNRGLQRLMMVNVCLFAMMIQPTQKSSVNFKTGFWSVCRQKAPATHGHRPVKITPTALGSFLSDPAEDPSRSLAVEPFSQVGQVISNAGSLHKGTKGECAEEAALHLTSLGFRDLENEQDRSQANAYCMPNMCRPLSQVTLSYTCTEHSFHSFHRI